MRKPRRAGNLASITLTAKVQDEAFEKGSEVSVEPTVLAKTTALRRGRLEDTSSRVGAARWAWK